MMKHLSLIFSMIIILYEVYKIFFTDKYWVYIIDKTPWYIKLLEFFYAFFIISLFFHTWFWIYGMGLTVLSLMIGLSIGPDIIKKHGITSHLKLQIRFESILSIGVIIALMYNIIRLFY